MSDFAFLGLYVEHPVKWEPDPVRTWSGTPWQLREALRQPGTRQSHELRL